MINTFNYFKNEIGIITDIIAISKYSKGALTYEYLLKQPLNEYLKIRNAVIKNAENENKNQSS